MDKVLAAFNDLSPEDQARLLKLLNENADLEAGHSDLQRRLRERQDNND